MSIATQQIAKVARMAAAPVMLLTLGACATGFNADVSRFTAQLPAPDGRTFAVVADDPELAGGLEFSQYADYVEAEMAQLGYTPVADPVQADLLVRFDYGVDNGRERVQSTGLRDPFYNSWYGYHPVSYRPVRTRTGGVAYIPYRSWGYGWHDPFFGGSRFGRGIDSYTVYTSGIDMSIADADTGERLFEGKAQAVSTSNRLQYLVPNLVEAMFTDFPGNSGETVRISVAPEDQPVRR